MLEAFLLAEKTIVTSNGSSPAVDLSVSAGRIFLLILHITDVIEQEALDVMVVGSPDGERWDAKPFAAFPQKFYCEEAPLLLDLTARPDIRFLRANWTVNRWGRGTLMPRFEISLLLREIPEEILAEASNRVTSR